MTTFNENFLPTSDLQQCKIILARKSHVYLCPANLSSETRMHSSRMRTGRSLTVCWGGERLIPGGVVSQHALRQTPPPVDRITDKSKNITLATTSLRPVKMTNYLDKHVAAIATICHSTWNFEHSFLPHFSFTGQGT